jgi:hypothetical protein
LIPEAISNHDYHITTSSPYLDAKDSTHDSVTLTTKDGDNIVTGVVYETHDYIRIPEPRTGILIEGNIATLEPEFCQYYFYDATIYATFQGTIIGSITVACFESDDKRPDVTPETYPYVTTETIGSLQIGNFNDNITMSVEPHNFSDMSAVQAVCYEDAQLPPGAPKAVKMTKVDNNK